jgi:hypothetical protein
MEDNGSSVSGKTAEIFEWKSSKQLIFYSIRSILALTIFTEDINV